MAAVGAAAAGVVTAELDEAVADGPLQGRCSSVCLVRRDGSSESWKVKYGNTPSTRRILTSVHHSSLSRSGTSICTCSGTRASSIRAHRDCSSNAVALAVKVALAICMALVLRMNNEPKLGPVLPAFFCQPRRAD